MRVTLKGKSQMARLKENGWWKLCYGKSFEVREATQEDMKACGSEAHHSLYYCVDIECGSIINKKAVRKVEL